MGWKGAHNETQVSTICVQSNDMGGYPAPSKQEYGVSWGAEIGPWQTQWQVEPGFWKWGLIGQNRIEEVELLYFPSLPSNQFFSLLFEVGLINTARWPEE